MTITSKVLIEAKYAEASQTTQYQTPSQTKTQIDKFTVTNNSASAATIAINLVVSGGTADAEDRILVTKSIVPGQTYHCPEIVGHYLDDGGFISTLAGTASALTIRASGREIT
jgi:hypothetical protein